MPGFFPNPAKLRALCASALIQFGSRMEQAFNFPLRHKKRLANPRQKEQLLSARRMKAGRPRLFWKILLLAIALVVVIAAVILLWPDNRGPKLVAETRQTL